MAMTEVSMLVKLNPHQNSVATNPEKGTVQTDFSTHKQRRSDEYLPLTILKDRRRKGSFPLSSGRTASVLATTSTYPKPNNLH
jgi:hypothetical protein